jgi:agmatinase
MGKTTTTFNPNLSVSSDLGIYGIPCSESDAKIQIIPIPWEVTTSYGKGTANGPKLIRRASEQVDLFDIELGRPYEAGYFMHAESKEIRALNNEMRPLAEELMALVISGNTDLKHQNELIEKVNSACEQMTNWVYAQTQNILNQGKWPVLFGGDHSTPLGAIKAISEHYKTKIGVLHFDAHADLRNAYQGFKQSHASIMYNVMNLYDAPQKLVQVGIRDFCEEEYLFIQNNSGRIKTFFDSQLKAALFEGQTWNGICQSIVSELPDLVYISFDIDGLNPSLCPNTGTPVPGGLSLEQVFYLFSVLYLSGKKLVGFDLNEVSAGNLASDEWNGNVGARLAYKLLGWLGKSQKLY